MFINKSLIFRLLISKGFCCIILNRKNPKQEGYTVIEVKNLTKKFGSHTAVDGISFTVNDGEILGFLGPNGAGKTTTMNMMTGFISSTEGEVKINGFDILSDPINAKNN